MLKDIYNGYVKNAVMCIPFKYLLKMSGFCAEYTLLPALLMLIQSSGIFHMVLSCICVILFFGLLYQLQDKLLFHPRVPEHNKVYVSIPTNVPHEMIEVQTTDRETLHCYLLKATSKYQSAPTLIYLHGNAGNAGSPCPLMLQTHCNVNVFSVEYRGYGRSTGTPSEEGLYEDARSCVTYLHTRQDIDTNKIILFGHSLGGAVAIHIAAELQRETRQKIAALIVENTFTSIKDVGRSIFKGIIQVLNIIPDCFYKNKFESIRKISNLRIPILFINGEKDEIVQPKMTILLYNAANNQKSCMVKIQNGHHNDTWCSSPSYHQYIAKFLAKVFNENINSDLQWQTVINV